MSQAPPLARDTNTFPVQDVLAVTSKSANDESITITPVSSSPPPTPPPSTPLPVPPASISTPSLPNSTSTAPSFAKPPAPPAPGPYTAFPPWRRNLYLAIVTCGGLLGPLSGAIYLPLLPLLAGVFDTSHTVINISVSLFMLTFAIGPLLWASFADYGGRKPLYLLSLCIYVIANILIAATPANIGGLMILRILQAFGACSVASLGAGTVADLVPPKNRATAMSVFLLGPQLGPILGPPIGGAIASSIGWRWLFYFLAIMGAVVVLSILFLLPETLRALVGNHSLYANTPMLQFPPRLVTRKGLVDTKKYPLPPKPHPRTYWNLLKYPPILLVSLNSALMFAAYYTLCVSLPSVLQSRYGFTTAETGYAYLAPGLAMVVGGTCSGRFSDLRLRRARKAAGVDEEGKTIPVIPERRLYDQVWGVLLSITGMLLYGWFAEKRIHVGATLAATFLCGFGLTWVFVTSTAYLTECSPAQAASLVALAGLVRNPAAAVAAAVIEELVEKMGVGWCFTGVAGVMVGVLCVLGVLVKMGPVWRARKTAEMARMKAEKERIVTEKAAVVNVGVPKSG